MARVATLNNQPLNHQQKKNRAPQITLSTLYNPKKPNENFLELTPRG